MIISYILSVGVGNYYIMHFYSSIMCIIAAMLSGRRDLFVALNITRWLKVAASPSNSASRYVCSYLLCFFTAILTL